MNILRFGDRQLLHMLFQRLPSSEIVSTHYNAETQLYINLYGHTRVFSKVANSVKRDIIVISYSIWKRECIMKCDISPVECSSPNILATREDTRLIRFAADGNKVEVIAKPWLWERCPEVSTHGSSSVSTSVATARNPHSTVGS